MPSNPQLLGEVDDVLIAIMDALSRSGAKRALLHMMLVSKRFFNLGAPFLYKNLSVAPFSIDDKVGMFLSNMFGTDPPNERVQGLIKTVVLKAARGTTSKDGLKPGQLERLLKSNPRLDRLGLIFDKNYAEYAKKPDSELWRVLREQGKMGQLDLHWAAFGAPLPETIDDSKTSLFPTSVRSVDVKMTFGRVGFGIYYPSGSSPNEILKCVLENLAKLPKLEAWRLLGLAWDQDNDHFLIGLPKVAETCQDIQIEETNLARLLRAGVALNPAKLSLTCYNRPVDCEVWRDIELPMGVKELHISTVPTLDGVAPLIDRAARLPHLETLVVGGSPRELFTRWPMLIPMKRTLSVKAGDLPALVRDFPTLCPSSIHIYSDVATRDRQMDRNSAEWAAWISEWKECWTVISSANYLKSLVFESGTKTLFLVGLKLPASVESLEITDPRFVLKPETMQSDFHQAREGLANAKRLRITFRFSRRSVGERTEYPVSREVGLWKSLPNVVWCEP